MDEVPKSRPSDRSGADEDGEPESLPFVGGELSSQELSAPARWLLLTGDRRHVALGLLAVVALLLSALTLSGVGAVENGDSLTRLFSVLAGGNLTLITVVITINQLIVSSELGTPDDLRDDIESVVEYRRAVERTADGSVSPITPEAFLDYLAKQLRDRAVTLHDSAERMEAEEPRDAVTRYAEILAVQSEGITEALESRPSGTFTTVLTVLDADFTADLYVAEQLRATYGESLPAETDDALEDAYELLEYMGAARQYFKSLYIERELAAFSRKILYSGVPAVAASFVVVWLYGHATAPALPEPMLAPVVVLAAAVAVSPLSILVAYVLRITTVTRRTVSLMPFAINERHPL